jgi:membrane-associated phospholipid phosphatase
LTDTERLFYLIGQYGYPAVFLLLVGLLATALAFYFAYRWVASHRPWIVGCVRAALSYPPLARLRERYDRQLRWLLRRVTPGEYLGLHLTVGLLLAVGCLWFFGDLAEDVVTNDWLVRFDQTVAVVLHRSAIPALTTFFVVVTATGSVEVLALLGLIVAVIYGLRGRWLPVGTGLAGLAGGAVLNQLLKELFARPRPSFADPLLSETSYSFPSGHAMLSLVVYGVLAYFAVLALQTWRAKTAVVFGIALLVVLIGVSRMYLGVHYFSDVLAGFAAGGMWLSALITGMETIRRPRENKFTKLHA